MTFAYIGLAMDASTAVQFDGQLGIKLFVADEMTAGNRPGQGAMAAVGMSIGMAFGRIAGTEAPAAHGHRARSELVKALNVREVKAELLKQGLTPQPGSRDELPRSMAAESAAWGKLIRNQDHAGLTSGCKRGLH